MTMQSKVRNTGTPEAKKSRASSRKSIGRHLPVHVTWLVDTKKKLHTADKKTIELWRFNHMLDASALSTWAKHFRNQYCSDSDIDSLISGTGLSRSDYLTNIVFPDQSTPPGPSVRAGDFAEVLVADYLEYLLNFWMPRTRYDTKAMRNVSTQGVDVMGFLLTDDSIRRPSPNDIMVVYEVKAQFSGSKPSPRLQDAVDGSAKDVLRKPESLNAIKRRFIERKMFVEAKRVERFQNPADNPYREQYGALAFFSTDLVDDTELCQTTCAAHPYKNRLKAVVMSGDSIMELVHKLYAAAANEA